RKTRIGIRGDDGEPSLVAHQLIRKKRIDHVRADFSIYLNQDQRSDVEEPVRLPPMGRVINLSFHENFAGDDPFLLQENIGFLRFREAAIRIIERDLRISCHFLKQSLGRTFGNDGQSGRISGSRRRIRESDGAAEAQNAEAHQNSYAKEPSWASFKEHIAPESSLRRKCWEKRMKYHRSRFETHGHRGPLLPLWSR